MFFKNSNLYCLGTPVSLWNAAGRQIVGDNWFIPFVSLRTTDPNTGFSDFSVSFCWFYKIYNNLMNTSSTQGGAGQQSSGRLGKPCPWAQTCSWRGALTQHSDCSGHLRGWNSPPLGYSNWGVCVSKPSSSPWKVYLKKKPPKTHQVIADPVHYF